MKKWILSTVIFCSFITLNVGVIFAENAACEGAKKKIDLFINKKPSTRSPFISPINLMHYDMELVTLFHNDIGVVNIVITDSLGTAVFQDIVDSSEQSQFFIDLSLYPSGSYTISYIYNDLVLYGSFDI